MVEFYECMENVLEYGKYGVYGLLQMSIVFRHASTGLP